MLSSCYDTPQSIHVIMKRAKHFVCQQLSPNTSNYSQVINYILEYASLSVDLHNFKTHQLLHFRNERVFDD